MTDLRKAAEMALSALHNIDQSNNDDAIEALRQALAQPEQAPVGYVTDSGMSTVFVAGVSLDDDTPLYTAPVNAINMTQKCVDKALKLKHELVVQDLKAPLTMNGVPLYPKREWVDLDEEEQKECWDEGGSQWAIYQNIASKLKEKNT